MNSRQMQLLEALKEAGCTSPVSRQEIVDACAASGAYACPPSWLTQDSARKVGRGLYDCPELASMSGSVSEPAPVAEPAPAPAPVVGSVETVESNVQAALAMGMTGGERATLVPDRFGGYVAWGHFSDVEQIVRSKQFYPIFVTGLSGNGKTLMVEQVCAKLKRECYRVNVTRQTDEDDLLGGFRLINGNTVWQDGPVVSAMKNGGVLLLDEIDLGGANLMCLQPVLEGKGVFLKKINQWVTPAPGFTVFATANTKGKGDEDGRFVGTNVLNEAFLDRFSATLEQEYPSRAQEMKMLKKRLDAHGIEDAEFVENLCKWAEIVRKSYYEDAVDEIITTRRLINVCESFAIFGDKTKAIDMSLARFDRDTKEAFLSLYSKIDGEINASPEDGAGTDTKCPF